MRKALIITYYWPPSGGGGVMRWLKFARYMPQFGWKPIIFTPENPDPSTIDHSLTSEIPSEAVILKLPIWEPYDIYRRITGKAKDTKFKAGYISEASSKGWKDRLSVFIRGNLMIPDPRKFWIKPAVRFLTEYLKDNPVDIIITTGPPHSMHLIGLKIRQKFDIPWLADFRDPWTNIDFYHKLRLTKWADRKHHALEKQVLEKADMVTTVSRGCADDIQKIASKNIEVLTNGFDPDDFSFDDILPETCFSIIHIGSFNKDRNPETLWQVMAEKARADETFGQNLKIRFVGQTDDSIIQSLVEKGLGENIEDSGYLDHRISLKLLKQSQVLLLPLNDAPNAAGIMPGKFFEYLAAERPIILIGPKDGDAAKIVSATGAGRAAGFKDKEETRRIIDDYYRGFLQKELRVNAGQIIKYSRKELTGQLVVLLENLINE